MPPPHPAGTSAALSLVPDSKEAKERERMCPEPLLCARQLGRPTAGALPRSRAPREVHPLASRSAGTDRAPPPLPRAPDPRSSQSSPAPKSRS